MRSLLISAAEPSGDLLAAELLTALRAHADFNARGIAGPAMRAAGVSPIARMEDISVMGLAEVVGRLGAVRRAQAAMASAIQAGADALVVVDAPDLHMPLAHKAKAAGVPAIGYVSPQVWAWRPGRVHHIAAGLDQLLCLFAFEPPLYDEAAQKCGTDVRWVGHPVRDRLPPRQPVDPTHFALFPGSREQERERLLRLFLEVSERVRAEVAHARFSLVSPAGVDVGPLPAHVHAVDDISAVADARAALTKSGTVTLELAVMGIPMVVAHKVHPVTHWIGRRVVTGVKHIALPNILAGAEVVPEFIQRLDAQELADALLSLPTHQPVDLSAIGESGASARAAAAVAEHWRAP